MKFLCDNCKAKYQIADEKVAGKTVRMKCRKCGHQIEVRSAVTEGTGSMPPPPPAGALPGVKAPPKPGGLATSLSATKPKAQVPAIAAPSALAGAFNKNVADAPASVGARDGNSVSIELSVSDEWYVAINGVPVGPVRISELRRKAATGAVTEESLCWQEGLEEWRPIRSIAELATLVREAATGNRPSLAGMEAVSPNPGRSSGSGFPSAPRTPAAPAAARTSTVPPAPVMPPAPMATAAPAAGTPPPRPGAPMAPAARSNVVPFRPSAPSMEDAPFGAFASSSAAAMAPATAPQFTPSPHASPNAPPNAMPAPAPQQLPISSPMMPLAAPINDPFAPPAPSGPMPAAGAANGGYGSMSPLQAPMMQHSQPSYGDQRSSFHPSQPSFSAMPAPAPMPVPVQAPSDQRRGGVPLWFWPILVLFLGFGGGAAFFVFKQQQPPQPVVIQVPAPTTAAPAPPPTDSATIEIPDPPTIAANDPVPKKPGGGGKKPAAGPSPSPGPEPKGLDLGGLGGGTGGPNVNAGPGPGGGAGGGLDQAGVERVVSAHRAGVKRTCWERGSNDQKSSVNVTVTANVAPNGTVSSVSSSGDDPVVGKCIETQVKTWSFPAPGSQTTINIPFKFVRQ